MVLAIVVLNKYLALTVEDIPYFKDLEVRYSEGLLKAYFAMGGPASQPPIAAMSVICK